MTTQGSDDSNDSSETPETECMADEDCGISFECVACGLTDTAGWCEPSTECTSDTECGQDGVCGYNVVSSEFRCLPAAYCG